VAALLPPRPVPGRPAAGRSVRRCRSQATMPGVFTARSVRAPEGRTGCLSHRRGRHRPSAHARIRAGAGPQRSSLTLRRCMSVRLGLPSDWVTTGTAERLTPRRFPDYSAQSRPARRAGDDDGWPLTGPGGSLWFVVDHGRRMAACGAGLDGSPGGGLGQCASGARCAGVVVRGSLGGCHAATDFRAGCRGRVPA